MNALQILLAKSIDYAGLFPPAELDMQSAVNNYADYHDGPDAWALGRFVLPVGRLPEFAEAFESLTGPRPSSRRWPLAALSGADLGADLDQIDRFNRRHGSVEIDTSTGHRSPCRR